MNEMTPDQHLLVAFCHRRAAVLRDLITLYAQLTSRHLTTAARVNAQPCPSGEARRIRQHIAALQAELAQLTAQIDQLEDKLDPPGSAEPPHRATIGCSSQPAGQIMLHGQRHCLSPRDSTQLAEDTTHVELDRRAADV
jgi:hypothetical protein